MKEICPDDFGVDPTKRKESDSGFIRILQKKKKSINAPIRLYIYLSGKPLPSWRTYRGSDSCLNIADFVNILLFFCGRAKTCHLKARCRENECCARHLGSSISHPDATSQRSLWRKKKSNNHQAGERSELLKRAQVPQLSWDDFSFLQHTDWRGEKKKLKGQAKVCFWSLSNLLLTCAPTLGTETVLTVLPVCFMVNIVASIEQNLICNIKKPKNLYRKVMWKSLPCKRLERVQKAEPEKWSKVVVQSGRK